MSTYQPLATTGNGSIYSSGYEVQQQQAIAQMKMINGTTGTTGGKRSKHGKRSKRNNYYKGGAEITPIPVAYSDGGGVNSAYAELTAVSNQQQTSAAYDNRVIKGGKRRRTNKRRKKTNKRRSSKRRKSRRHR